MQTKAKGHLHDIWQAETRAEAEVAFKFFVETYGVKGDKTVAKPVKDPDALPTFHDYPATTTISAQARYSMIVNCLYDALRYEGPFYTQRRRYYGEQKAIQSP